MATQDSLFISQCAEKCGIYDLCGGSAAAPCGCMWSDERQFACDKCPYICHDRKSAGYSLESQIQEGASLESVRISQPAHLAFPAFIPLSTDEVNQTMQLPWVGADLKFLLTNPEHCAASPAPKLRQGTDVKQHLSVSLDTRLIAVLNGTDDRLERFWGMGEVERRSFFALLRQKGFEAVTAPTFSVTDEASGFPALHNVFMQRRHHKVLSEIHDAGLVAIPNLYWRAEQDCQEWVVWLSNNDISIVSLDFSRSKPTLSFLKRLEDLMKVLENAKRAIHVLLVKAGLVNGLIALKQLRIIGCTSSIVSSNPVKSATSGGIAIELSQSGKLKRVKRIEVSKKTLAALNIACAERFLRNKVDDLSSKSLG